MNDLSKGVWAQMWKLRKKKKLYSLTENRNYSCFLFYETLSLQFWFGRIRISCVILSKEAVLIDFNGTTPVLRNHVGLNILLDQTFKFWNFHWLDGDLPLGHSFYYHSNKIWNLSKQSEMGSFRLKMETCEIQLLFMYFPHIHSSSLASSYAGIYPWHAFDHV